MVTNASRFSGYNVSLKNYFFILPIVCLIFSSASAKEVGLECEKHIKPCKSAFEASQNKPHQIKLKFERVIDGDTLIAEGRKIRIWGIDAPEKGDPAFRVSGWLLQSLVENKILICELINVDKYKRDVMKCNTDELDIGATMVKFGMARDYPRYSAGYYEPEEKEAKSKRRGIWGNIQIKN